jgi:hypothetical protein
VQTSTQQVAQAITDVARAKFPEAISWSTRDIDRAWLVDYEQSVIWIDANLQGYAYADAVITSAAELLRYQVRAYLNDPADEVAAQRRKREVTEEA